MSPFMQWAASAALALIGSNEAAFAQAACDRDCLRTRHLKVQDRFFFVS
jgi:hypothetical protein